jgi:ribosome modulation factor
MGRKPSGSGGTGARRGRRATPAPGAETPPPPGGNKVASPALIAEAVARYVEDRGIVARAASHCGAHLAQYEAQGVDPAIVKLTAAAMKLSQKEAAARHDKLTEYMVAANVVLPEDLDWSQDQGGFAFKPATGDAADRVAGTRGKSQGYKAGRKGHSREGNPYKHLPGSPQFVGWLDGLQEGLEDRKALKPDAERTVQASTTRRRREPAGDSAAAGSNAPPTDAEVSAAVADELSATVDKMVGKEPAADPTVH